MGSRKSRTDTDFYVRLILNVLEDVYRANPTLTSREKRRNANSILSRVRCEGVQFLSVALPRLGKAIDSALESGRLIVPPGFARKSKAGVRWNIPVIFSDMFTVDFTREGLLKPDAGTILPFLRALCYCCYKISIDSTTQQLETAESKFIDIDKSLPEWTEVEDRLNGLSRPYGRRLLVSARRLLRKLFEGFDPSEIAPRHGPGAVADRSVKGRRKYEISFYSRSIDQLYPYATFMSFGINTQRYEDLVDHVSLPRQRPAARVVFVPKDSRGPRVISAEPALLQYLQQGLARRIVRLVETHPLTSGRVNFADQTVNRKLALSSSVDGEYATIDLADASDRVSLDLVKGLLPESLFPYLDATRSETTTLPSGREVRLRKFAPMGSALCFPIEALIFWAICQSVVLVVSRGRRSTSPSVFVYGDDIIIKSEYYELVIEALEAFGLSVNFNKSFVRGKFRESCGMDAFKGEDVTPVKIHAHVTRARNSSFRSLYSLSEQASELFDRGYWTAAEYVWRYVEDHIGRIPCMPPSFPGIKRTSWILPFCVSLRGTQTRWNPALQRVEARALCLRARRMYSPFTSDSMRLGHNLLQGMPRPYEDYVAVPYTAQNAVRWWAPITFKKPTAQECVSRIFD